MTRVATGFVPLYVIGGRGNVPTNYATVYGRGSRLLFNESSGSGHFGVVVSMGIKVDY